MRRARGCLAMAAMLAPLAAAAQPAPQSAPPERIGPVWDHREHQPNPAEIEARERVRGLPQERGKRQEQEVDQLYRSLTGSDPNAPARSTQSRDMDRR